LGESVEECTGDFYILNLPLKTFNFDRWLLAMIQP
jgi:hypothetical protein